MYRDVVNHLEVCGPCTQRRLKKHVIPMQEMPMPQYPFEIVGIDTCGPYNDTDSGNRYILTLVDHFSGWPEAYATPDKSAETVACILLTEFLPRHT